MAPTSKASMVLGYHGTTLVAAETILGGTPFRQSTNPWDWLGPGIYFWQDAPDLASYWGRKIHPSEPLAIIEAEISLDRCFDLFDTDVFPLLQRSWQRYEEDCRALSRLPQTQVPLDVLNGKCLTPQRWGYNRADCEMFKTLIGLNQESDDPFTTIRSAFLEGEGVHPTSFVFDLAHVQISVLDLSAVTVKTFFPA